MSQLIPPINFQQWIEDNRHLLKPPVGNQVVYKDTEFIIMVVGGPNKRKDFHYDEAEEFFYQLEGDMVLHVQEEGRQTDIPIREGEIFLLPARVPTLHKDRRTLSDWLWSGAGTKENWTVSSGTAMSVIICCTRILFS